jgi:hypothetical protein
MGALGQADGAIPGAQKKENSPDTYLPTNSQPSTPEKGKKECQDKKSHRVQ